MTLRHLRILVAVCTYGSITKAAAALHIAQPSVSVAITELEQYYHLHLFDRISRKLYITQEGEQFLKYANQITSMFEEMELSIHEWKDQELLHLGSSITIANSMLCSCLQQYKKLYPMRSVQVTIENSSNLEQMVLDNEIDIALMEGVPMHIQLQKESFFQDELVVLCAKQNPLAKRNSLYFHDIMEEPFLLREKGSGTRDILDSIMQAHNILLHPIWESASTQALVKGVMHNFGLSILPYQMIKEEIRQHKLHRLYIEDISFERDYYIISHVHKFPNTSMKDFIACCKDTCAHIKR